MQSVDLEDSDASDKGGRITPTKSDACEDDLAFYYRSGIASRGSSDLVEEVEPNVAEERVVSGRGRVVASWFSRKLSQDGHKPSGEAVEASGPVRRSAKRNAAVPNDDNTLPSSPASERRGHFTSPSKRTGRRLVNPIAHEADTKTAKRPPALPSHPSSSGEAAVTRSSPEPRKVFSLLLRRKSSRNAKNAATVSADGAGSEYLESDELPFLMRRASVACGDRSAHENHVHSPSSGAHGGKGDRQKATMKRRGFRRVQSQLHPPVSNSAGGEGGRYLEYAAELDDDSFERLVEFTKQIARRKDGKRPSFGTLSRSASREGVLRVSNEDEVESDEIIGEIRLEDFADGSSEDFDFLDDDISEQCSTDVRSSSRNVRMDSQKLTWIGNEDEFAAFFADFGLDEVILDGDSAAADGVEFNVEPELLAEWENAADVHNRECRAWVDVQSCPLDIRQLVGSFRPRSGDRGLL